MDVPKAVHTLNVRYKCHTYIQSKLYYASDMHSLLYTLTDVDRLASTKPPDDKSVPIINKYLKPIREYRALTTKMHEYIRV